LTEDVTFNRMERDSSCGQMHRLEAKTLVTTLWYCRSRSRTGQDSYRQSCIM